MITRCPCCLSLRIASKNTAKKTCGLIGMISGIASGMTGLLSGAELGGTIGLIAGPGGATLGVITGAIVGAATGGIAGAKLGEVIDERILDNYQCLCCGFQFNRKFD